MNAFFARCWYDVAKDANDISKNSRWWDDNEDGSPPNPAEKIALMHSELSEALEGLRHDNPPDHHLKQFGNVEVELADAVIRIMDFSHHYGYRVGDAILAKMAYNATRAPKHGGKKF